MSEKETTKNKKTNIWSAGRRKTGVARIKMVDGNGEITVNDREFSDYFPSEADRNKILSPFKETGRDESVFNISIKTQGGGKKGHVDAAMLGIARALENLDPELGKLLRKKGLLTRDPRMKERKKYNLHKARRAHQFSKR